MNLQRRLRARLARALLRFVDDEMDRLGLVAHGMGDALLDTQHWDLYDDECPAANRERHKKARGLR